MESDKRLEKYNKEIQMWLENPPETLSRLKRFYESIVSIHLGGEGLQTLIFKTETIQDAKLTVAMYEINYPTKNRL